MKMKLCKPKTSIIPRIIILLFAVLPLTDGIPRILHGRPRGGFLGKPGGSLLTDNSLSYREGWFVQKLNNFDLSDGRTWKQKYYVNDQHYKPGGPLFVQIGGEGKASPTWVVNGAWMDYARRHNAYCILVEHRFYGDSHPTPDMSTENLKYLSSEQALADLANIVTYFKDLLGGSKVIVFGGSYSGALAAWFRMKYPHLAHGAIASSAPVLAKVNFKEYFDVAYASLFSFDDSDACASNINFATAYMTYLMDSRDGRAILKKKFRLCTDVDMTNPKDVDNFYNTLAGNIAGVIQYNKDNRAFEGAKDASVTIDKVCHMMTSNRLGSQVDRYEAVNNLLLAVHGEDCLDFAYAPMIRELQAVSWNSTAAEGGRQWVYQTCVEFAFFQTSNGSHQTFGNKFPLRFSIDQCADIFGPKFTEAIIYSGVKETNIRYGGQGLQVTRVLFPNGSIDPWHALSILKDLNKETRALYINGTAHCANMYPPAQTDLPELSKARLEIDRTIGEWLMD